MQIRDKIFADTMELYLKHMLDGSVPKLTILELMKNQLSMEFEAEFTKTKEKN